MIKDKLDLDPSIKNVPPFEFILSVVYEYKTKESNIFILETPKA